MSQGCSGIGGQFCSICTPGKIAAWHCYMYKKCLRQYNKQLVPFKVDSVKSGTYASARLCRYWAQKLRQPQFCGQLSFLVFRQIYFSCKLGHGWFSWSSNILTEDLCAFELEHCPYFPPPGLLAWTLFLTHPVHCSARSCQVFSAFFAHNLNNVPANVVQRDKKKIGSVLNL